MSSARAAVSLIKNAIRNHGVVVFSKTTCPFSILAKKILSEAGVEDMKVFEIERRQDTREIQVRIDIFKDHNNAYCIVWFPVDMPPVICKIAQNKENIHASHGWPLICPPPPFIPPPLPSSLPPSIAIFSK